MSIIACLLSILLLAPAAIAGGDERLQPVNEKLRRGQPVLLASIGDSITWVCFHTDGRRNYLTFVADALSKLYPTAKIRLEQSGNRGSTARAMPFLETLLHVKPDLVFIMFGMNDCKRGLAQLDDYDRNLAAMIRRVREAKAIPVLLTQNEIVYPADGREALPQYVARATLVAQRENVVLVDNFSDWQNLQKEAPDTWKLYLNDVMHPDLFGHRRFARAILRQLWPEAAAFHDSGIWPLARKLGQPVDCLLPGPPDKQVLRIGPSTWITVSGRRRGSEVTDLVLSVAEKANPRWEDFRHVTLVGPNPDALFPWGERNINSAFLLRSENRLFVLFSHTVRRSLLTIDTSRTGWINRLNERRTYETFDRSNVPLPQSMGGSYQGDTEFLDGYAEHGQPAFFYRDIVLNESSGVMRTSLPKFESAMVFPGFTKTRAGTVGDEWIAVGQADAGRELAAVSSSATKIPLPPMEAKEFEFGLFGNVPLLIHRAERGVWRVTRLSGDQWREIELPQRARLAQELAAFTFGETATLLGGDGESVAAYTLRDDAFSEFGTPQKTSLVGSWRYEDDPPAEAANIGVLSERNGLVFSTVRLPVKPDKPSTHRHSHVLGGHAGDSSPAPQYSR